MPLNFSVQFSHSVVSDSLWPHGLQYTRLPYPSSTPEVYSNSCPTSWWCHPTSHPLSSPSPPAFNLSQRQGLSNESVLHTGGQSIGALTSASVHPMNIQDWFLLALTGLIWLQSKGLPRVFSITTVQKHQFFGPQPSLWWNCHINTWLLEKPKLWLHRLFPAKYDVSAF